MNLWKVLLVIFTFAAMVSHTEGQTVTVAVRVSLLDQEGHKLQNAVVRAYGGRDAERKVNMLAEGVTDQLGNVTLRLQRGVVFKLRIDGPEAPFPYFPAVVPSFQADRDARFQRVLFRSALAYDTYELLEILSALEFVYALDQGDGGIGVARYPSMWQRYRLAIGMLKFVDDLTRDRYEFVKNLYDTTR